jgi:transcriptional regulator with XRE-family HTH domain
LQALADFASLGAVTPAGNLAAYLTELRSGTDYSLRDVERLTGGVVSNVYLSQLENDHRRDPHPKVLVALAKVYGVPWQLMFEKAGFVEGTEPSRVDVAFGQVLADPTFNFGTRFGGELDEAGKRVIIELYERATDKKLLTDDAD